MRRAPLALALALALAPRADAAPARCDIGVKVDGDDAHGRHAGKLTRFEPRADDPGWIDATLDDGGRRVDSALRFTLWVAPELRAAAPGLAALDRGAALTITYACGGVIPIECDAVLEDGHGAPLAIIAERGADLAGWHAEVGDVLKAVQDRSTAATSVRRTHAVSLHHGATTATVQSGRCAEVRDGAITYLATGLAISWLGQRPPEGIDRFDRRAYTLIRATPTAARRPARPTRPGDR